MAAQVDKPPFDSLKEKNAMLKELTCGVPDSQRQVVTTFFYSSHAETRLENNYQNEGPAGELTLLTFLKAFYAEPVILDGSNKTGGVNFLAIYRKGDRFIPIGLRKDLIIQPMRRLYVDAESRLHLSTWKMEEDFIGVPGAETLFEFNLQNTNKLVFLTNL